MSSRGPSALLAMLFCLAAGAAEPQPPAEPPKEKQKRFYSRWKPGADGSITLWNGKDTQGWEGAPENWQVVKGQLRGTARDGGTAFLRCIEADWADYCLAAELMLGTTGTIVLHHNLLAVQLGKDSIRLGYPQETWRTLDQKPKGLSRKMAFYKVEFDVKGNEAELRINDAVALKTDQHKPTAGAPAIEVIEGGVAFTSIRLKLHESDQDYRAVVLGEGYDDDPRGRPVEQGEKVKPLGPGQHVLFNKQNLQGWEKAGEWAVRDGEMVATAPRGAIATAYVPATDAHSDYVITARCRIARHGLTPKEGEALLILFRQQRPDNFLCFRFGVEGIFEIGYYLNGQFREIHRGVSKGDYAQWRNIEVTVRGNQLSLIVDKPGQLPTWKFTSFARGAVGVGVTGTDAAFSDVRVRILR